MTSEPLHPTILSSARAALLAADPDTEVIAIDAQPTTFVAGSMIGAFVGGVTLGVFSDQALTAIFRKRASAGDYRDAPDDDGDSPTTIPANTWTDVRVTFDADAHRLVLKTGGTPPTAVELAGRVYSHGQRSSETAAASYQVRVDATEAGPKVLVPRQAGRTFKITRLEVEPIAAGDRDDVETPSEVTIGSNDPDNNNIIPAGRLSLTWQAVGDVLRFGAFDAVAVDDDLVVDVKTAQVGGAAAAVFRCWGFY